MTDDVIRNTLNHYLSVGAVKKARIYLSAYPLSDSKLQKYYENVLEPPKATVCDKASGSDFGANIRWIKSESEPFRGNWVALKNGKLIDHDKDRYLLHNRLKDQNLLEGCLFTIIAGEIEMFVLNKNQLDYIFSLVERLKGIKDDLTYHPEENVFVHSCQVVK
jgi:hypothetical protein